MASLLATGWLKVNLMGWPIPTVSPSLGKTEALRVAVGITDWKCETCRLGLPWPLVASMVTV